MTEILPANSPKAIKTASKLLREGDVVAFPTDTIYGVGANALERFAIDQIYALKQRPIEKGLPVFIYQIDDLNLVARDVPNSAWAFLRRFWPGPLTVVLPKNPALSDEVTGGLDTIAVRIPDHIVCLDLVVEAGVPLAVTSANISGQPTPDTAQGVARQLQDQLPLVLDGGPSPGNQPSTIVDLTTSPPRILRQGALEAARLQEFLPTLKTLED